MKNDVLIDDQKKKSLTVTNLIWMGFTVVYGYTFFIAKKIGL